MSMSDSDTASLGSEYKNFRQISRDRLLYEMLRSTKTGDSKSSWKVLIMDKLTVRIMSYACKMADITEEGVSLVEDIHKRRQPLPSMDGIYFIQPTKENIVSFLSDMSGRTPLYKKYVKCFILSFAGVPLQFYGIVGPFVFFSSNLFPKLFCPNKEWMEVFYLDCLDAMGRREDTGVPELSSSPYIVRLRSTGYAPLSLLV
ncbi:SNARE-interacting protein KEULE-like [Salvia splendens]|uniref:SNARE-interacting protein KEULE-like n=1 Tax=Salvia splendens TaxID=180675 RepID=UPI001C2704B2|nr:SNARE-interacting protein KEULE-like [Salvia splendens]